MADQQPAARLRIGAVVSRTFGAIGANFVTFFLLAVLLAAIPTVLLGYASRLLTAYLLREADFGAVATISGFINLLAALVLMIPTYVLVGALTQGGIVHYNGGKASFGECLSTGLRLVVPLIGLGLMTVLGLILYGLLIMIPAIGLGIFQMFNPIVTFVAMIIFLVPVIMAIVRWATAAPALVVESTGVMAAFRRSGDLTRNNRWAIFFLGLIVLVISVLIQGAITFASVSLLGGFGDELASASLILSAVAILYSALSTMIIASGQAALYFELRVMKEGATTEELARIFE